MTVHQLPASSNNVNQQTRYQLFTGDTMVQLPPLEWRIKDVLPAAGLAVIYGPPSSGKSFLALDMAAAIADGGMWFGHIVKPSPVVYVALEGERGFPKRVKAWTQHNSRIPPADLFFILDSFNLASPADIDDLAAVCPKGCVLIIDTLNRASPQLDENSSRDMGNVLAACKELAQQTQGLVLLIHHTGKDESRGLRGHSSLLAALDTSIEVSRTGDQRAWSVAKAKDENDNVWHGFRLTVEQVGFDDDGDEITSCAIDSIGCNAPNPQGKIQKTILGPIQALLESEGKVGNPGVPDGVPSITFSSAVQCAAEQLTNVPPSHRASRVKDAIEGLVKRGVLKTSNLFIWQ